ncbi:uncharacterized protein CTHT_0015960 [Thermochaetoides thermophila DSM 1495]|uniref:Uncharacterized protein n=1 Tax=Chaetomium thermophilum (strain DSM 1495 / CBS 144.50 / IMI 039719) TaxID=759272 RepID=G0S247_CHATD|nr:hypothetical protein CTHT_0015960 [Thermochaetoides thermophila DSM 1495]EGS23107.1 hypothetical protein CTHT_0015960 [Thermochaetoides thermophila DSM 1495]
MVRSPSDLPNSVLAIYAVEGGDVFPSSWRQHNQSQDGNNGGEACHETLQAPRGTRITLDYLHSGPVYRVPRSPWTQSTYTLAFVASARFRVGVPGLHDMIDDTDTDSHEYQKYYGSFQNAELETPCRVESNVSAPSMSCQIHLAQAAQPAAALRRELKLALSLADEHSRRASPSGLLASRTTPTSVRLSR